MVIEIIDKQFTICKISDLSEVDFSDEFCFFANTDEELSLVCPIESVPGNVSECNEGWRAFRIKGTLDFSLIGIIAKISTLLADNDIGLFAVSTYNTDYIFTKDVTFKNAINILSDNGYELGA